METGIFSTFNCWRCTRVCGIINVIFTKTTSVNIPPSWSSIYLLWLRLFLLFYLDLLLCRWLIQACGWWSVYSCCSYLEHRASVKRFVSLQFLNLRHPVGLLGRVISPSQGRYLTQTQNKYKQTSMSRLGVEPTFPALERAMTFHALDRGATVIGNIGLYTSPYFVRFSMKSMHL
jgi:hypothetical protein